MCVCVCGYLLHLLLDGGGQGRIRDVEENGDGEVGSGHLSPTAVQPAAERPALALVHPIDQPTSTDQSSKVGRHVVSPRKEFLPGRLLGVGRYLGRV